MQSLNRITIITNVAIVLVVCSACSPSTRGTGPNQGAVVVAGGETLRGEVVDDDSRIVVFRGIPYAAPPTGTRRWRPPAAHVPREGEQDATRFTPACPQLQGNHDWYRKVATLFGNPPETIGSLDNIDEDCLYLNIWSGTLSSNEKWPVMVWIYGGSNIHGYAHEPNYLGHNVAQQGVVYVSINYRLGALGFMAHPGLSAESPRQISGNYALQDQIAALRWVQDNIAAFGGDPGNVTVAGESSGGYNIAWLIASPHTQGLFHRAIIQSGGWAVDSFQSLDQAELAGEAIATGMGFGKPQSDVEIIEAMRELDWRTIVNGDADAYSGWHDAVNDGYWLTAPAAATFARGSFNNVDLLIGANENESFMYLEDVVTKEDLHQMIADYGGPYADDLAEILRTTESTAARRVMDRLGSRAGGFLCASRFIANSMASHDNNVYFYYFTRVRPDGENILAYHGAEIPYVFGTADEWLPGDAIDHRLSAAMLKYWVNFVATGSPNGDGLPRWPAFFSDARNYLQFGDSIEAGADLESAICDILDQRRQDVLNDTN